MSCEDLVLGDDDGVLFLPSPQTEEIFTLAETISDTEQHQAKRIRAGVSLRSQVQFRAYLAKREKTPFLRFCLDHTKSKHRRTRSFSEPWRLPRRHKT